LPVAKNRKQRWEVAGFKKEIHIQEDRRWRAGGIYCLLLAVD
jgi:hypothetical protein